MINYNADPFYDDFNPSKNFHRILFKPGYSVQARELTQSQTILQNQISEFASAIYSQNTPVSGGKVTTNLKCNYIKLNSTYGNTSLSVTPYKGSTITDVTGTILAQVIAVSEATGNSVVAGDPPTLIVTYLSGGQFSDGMTIYQVQGVTSTPFATTIGTSGGTTSVGSSSVASVGEGVFYVVNGYNQITDTTGVITKYSIGNFVNVYPQTVILDKYDSTPSLRVGLNITEKTVTYIDDSSLLDPAIGATNYQAPGADRYQIILTLETRPLTLGNDDGFIELLRLTGGQIQKQSTSTVYSAIDDYLAKRTYDTNGDFIVNSFNITPTTNTSNSQIYNLGIGPGSAYVSGYRVENQSPLVLTNNRARTTASQNNNPVFVDYGNYLYIDTLKGVFDVTTNQIIDFHCVPYSSINTASVTAYASTKVGSGYIRNLIYDHNTTDANTLSYVYKAYVADFTANTLTANAASGTTTTVTITDTTGVFANTANAYYGVQLSITSGTSAGDVRYVSGWNQATKTFTVSKAFSVSPDSTSKVQLNFNSTNIQSLANTVSTTINAKANINTQSKVNTVVNGVSYPFTNFQSPGSTELLFNIGYPYLAAMSNAQYASTQMFRNKAFVNSSGSSQIQITLPVGIQNIISFAGGVGTLSTSAIEQNYTAICTANAGSAIYNVGDVIPLVINSRTVSISSDKNTLTITAPDTANITTGMTVSILAKVNVINGDDTNHVVRAKNLVTGNTSVVSTSGPDGTVGTYTFVDLTNGQVYIQNAGLVTPGSAQYLYVTDVRNIVKIIDTGAPGTTPTVPMLSTSSYDVTANYIFDNGQRDNSYQHARITLRPGAPQPKGNLLVVFNFYKHAGGDGYFSGMSYLTPISTSPEAYGAIPTYVAKDGITYNLRDCLDFRPARKNATANITYEYTGNPLVDDTGTYIPQDLTNFTSNYSYYLGRSDLLVLTKDNAFKIIPGVPSVNPTLPSAPDGSLVISNLYHQPYTAYLPVEAPATTTPSLSVQAVQHQRFTMQDISGLQNRINNLEYYTSLSMLEQNAAALQVMDSNGLNRFKNGILVDNFSSFSAADTGNPDFNASIDSVNQQMSAAQSVTNYPLQSSVLLNALGNPSASTLKGLGFAVNTVNQTTNMFSLPYTENVLVKQQLASNTINLNPFTTPIFSGSMSLNPPMDNWVDNTKAPSLLLVDPSLTLYQQSNTLNVLSVGNWQSIPGTQYSTSSSYSVVNHGQFYNPYVSNNNWLYGYTATSSQTYADVSQTTLSGYWSKLPSTYNTNNGFITNVAIQAFIRPQEIVARAGSLQVNTPLTCSFDNTIVNQYIQLPTVVELTGVSGSFNPGDTVGYLTGSTFNVVGQLIDVYNYPGTTNTRLYGYFFASIMSTVTISTLVSAKFDANENYVSSIATGTPKTGTTNGVTLNMSGGVVAALNGTSTSISGGGTYYTGVTQIQLSPLASSNNQFYVGSTVSVTANNGTSSTTSTSIVSAYNGSTKAATLATPVNVSIGFNTTSGALLTSSYAMNGTATCYISGISSNTAPRISTNEAGNFAATFAIPAGTFQTGSRVFQVDNRTVATDSTTSTTSATATFTASGLSTTSQALDFAPSIDSASNVFTSTQFKSNQLISSTSNYTVYDPVAQTFLVDKANYPNGVFLSSVRFFFQSKATSTNAPVSLSIVGTTNGYPNGATLDNSIVTLTPDQVNVSSTPHYLDSTSYTTFTFQSPVFIAPNTLYAFILHSQSTEYNVYLAAQNAIAIPSSVKNTPTDPTPTVLTKIGTSPYVGSLFESQNSITWTADQTKALMFVINQASFDTTKNPKIAFVVPQGLPTRKSTINVINRAIQPNTVVSLNGSLTASNVLSHAYNITTTDLLPTTTLVNYSYNSTLSSTGAYSGETSVTPGRYGSPTLTNVYLADGKGPRTLVANSNSSFLLYASLTSTDPNVSPVVSDDGLALYNINWNINNLPVTNTQITLVSGGSSYNANTTSVSISAPDISGGTQAYASANVVGGVIQNITITNGGSGYLNSPTINITDIGGGSGAVLNVASEFSPSGGNAAARYITKKVVLSPGNDSGDLRVFLTAYRPSGSNIYVFYKILNAGDSSPFTSASWQQMTPIMGGTFYSTTQTPTAEFEFAPGINGVANNYVSYTSANGQKYNSFIQFAIKVVLTTADNTSVPYLTNIQALALPPGTGF